MPDVNVYEAFKELVQRLLSGDQEVAELAASDPEGLLAAYGITEGNLDGVDFRQAVDECYHDYDLGDGSKQALQSYVAGGAPPDHYQVKAPPGAEGYQGPEHAVQHLQYVTYATYENNEAITREIVNQQFTIDQSDNRVFDIDNSTDVSVDVGRNFDGDITVAPTTVTGDGAVANNGDDNVFGTGEGDVLAASRGGEVNAAIGDGAVQGEEIGAANTGLFEGVQAGEEVRGAVNTGENTGVVADGRVEGTVVGDGNQTANLDINTSAGDGGNASGTGGGGTGGLQDSRVDLFGDDIRDSGVDGSGTGGDGIGGNASGGGGGDVGPINLNFGSGDQTATGEVRDSSVASGGDASNDQSVELPEGEQSKLSAEELSARERLERLLEQERQAGEAQEAQLPALEETDVDILPVASPGDELGQELSQLEEVATASSQEDDASLGV